MKTVAILGTAGYTGQETLDRVLDHPGLELVALGSDSHAGQPATALDPRLPERLAAGVRRRTPRPPRAAPTSSSCASSNERAAALEPPADAVVVDLSGAHRLADTSLYPQWYGFEHPKPDGAEWSYALPELQPPTGRADREPRLLRDRGAARARAARATSIDPASVVVDAKSGVSGAGRAPKRDVASRASCSRTSRRTRSAATGTRPRSQQLLGFAPCASCRTCCRCAAACSRPVTSTASSADVARAARGGVRGQRRSCACCRRASRPSSRACRHTDAAEIGVFADRADRHGRS